MAKKKRRFAPTDLGVKHVDADGDGINDGVQLGDTIVGYDEEVEVDTDDREGELTTENNDIDTEETVEAEADYTENDGNFETRNETNSQPHHEEEVTPESTEEEHVEEVVEQPTETPVVTDVPSTTQSGIQTSTAIDYIKSGAFNRDNDYTMVDNDFTFFVDDARVKFNVSQLNKFYQIANDVVATRFMWHVADNEAYRLPSNILTHTEDSHYHTVEEIGALNRGILDRLILSIPAPAHMGGIRKLANKPEYFDDEGQLRYTNDEAVNWYISLIDEAVSLFPHLLGINIGGDEFAFDINHDDEQITFFNKVADHFKQKGLIVTIWNDGLTRSNFLLLDKEIEIYYWSFVDKVTDPVRLATLKRNRATFDLLVDNGYRVHNANNYYSYAVPTRKGSSQDQDYAARDALLNFRLSKWNVNDRDHYDNEQNIAGGFFGIWSESLAGANLESIPAYIEDQAAVLSLITRSTTDELKQRHLDRFIQNDFEFFKNKAKIDTTMSDEPIQFYDYRWGAIRDVYILNEEELYEQGQETKLYIMGTSRVNVYLSQNWSRGKDYAWDDNGFRYYAYASSVSNQVIYIGDEVNVITGYVPPAEENFTVIGAVSLPKPAEVVPPTVEEPVTPTEEVVPETPTEEQPQVDPSAETTPVEETPTESDTQPAEETTEQPTESPAENTVTEPTAEETSPEVAPSEENTEVVTEPSTETHEETTTAPSETEVETQPEEVNPVENPQDPNTVEEEPVAEEKAEEVVPTETVTPESVGSNPDVSVVETPVVTEKEAPKQTASPTEIFKTLIEERLRNFMASMSPGVANTEKTLQDHQMELNSIFMKVIFAKDAKMFEAGFLSIYQSFRANLNLVFPVYRRFAGLMTMPRSRMTDDQLNLHNTLIDLFCNLADDDYRPRMAARYNFSMLTRYLTDPFALNRVIEEVKEMIS